MKHLIKGIGEGALISLGVLTVIYGVNWGLNHMTQAQAQGSYYQPQQLFINATNSVAGTTTNTPNSIADCRGGKELTVGVTSQFIAAGVSNVTFYFEKSMDGVNFEPTPSFNYAWQGNGTNVIVGITNFTLNACPFVRLSHVANTSAAFPTTNTSIRVFVK